MHVQKISASLPQQQFNFIEEYKEQHHYKTRSEVIKDVLYLLQQSQLEACYREATQEIDEAFDITDADELENNETL